MIATGLDLLLQDTSALKGKNIALIANQTSVTRDLDYSWNALAEKGIRLKRIFSPEHGLFATEQDQVAVTVQPETGCDIVSLYGDCMESLLPDESLFDDIDILLFDIQDIGARYYTYVNTLALIMEAIDGRDIELIILDRPNPLGGIHVEGPMPDPAYRSFVGIFPVPVRHAMTPGELAHLYRDWRKIDINLTVISLQGWQRNMNFSKTGLPWIPPSPNMPTTETALVYPGMCLLEGLNISEGRGTTTPFLHFGAPFIEPYDLKKSLDELELEGVIFRPTFFKPSFHKYSNEVAGGLFLHVCDPESFDAFSTAIALTAALQRLYPQELRFLDEVYEFNATFPAFDLLCGSGSLRRMISENRPFEELRASWKKDEAAFLSAKEIFHLY